MKQKTPFLFKNTNYVLILGAGGLGAAIAKEVKARSPNSHIFITSRYKKETIPSVDFIRHDPLCMQSWQNLVTKIREKTSTLDSVISTIGVLHNEDLQPEKRLQDINLEDLITSFSVNAFTAPLTAKYLVSFFSKETPSTLSFLSAKVGSISDNQMGGWYSYRASKSALNMFIKTMALEFEQKRLNISVTAIHPGTTQTELSRPFLSHTNLKVWAPHESANHICNTIESSYKEGTGLFRNWDSSELPW